jgi:hypothetical protein
MTADSDVLLLLKASALLLAALAAGLLLGGERRRIGTGSGARRSRGFWRSPSRRRAPRPAHPAPRPPSAPGRRRRGPRAGGLAR